MRPAAPPTSPSVGAGSAEAADICAVSDFCAFSCAAPAPPQPATHEPAPPTDCVCVEPWFVGAEFDESACDLASTFWFDELGPELTPPAEIVTGTFAFTGVCFVSDLAAEACAVSDFCAFSCAPPAPPQPPRQLPAPPTDCVCEDDWFVGAEFDELECDLAAAFWLAELGPELTSPAEIVTGAFAFTGVCCVPAFEADTWAVTAAWMDACSPPGPPDSAAATAGTAAAAATVATSAISLRFITPPWSSFCAPPVSGRRINRRGALSRVARAGGRSGAVSPVDATGHAGSRPPRRRQKERR